MQRHWETKTNEKPKIPAEIASGLKHYLTIGEPAKFACYCRGYTIEDDKIKIEGVLNMAAPTEKTVAWDYYDNVQFYGSSDPIAVFSPPIRLEDSISIAL